jgi:hypothetical protein
MMLTFKIAAVREVIARGISDAEANGGFRDPHCGMSGIDNRKPGLWLVGDHGVYLCSNGALAKNAKPLVAYADECDPRRNDGWFEVKRRTFGRDDGVDFFYAQGLEALMAASPGCTRLRIAFLPNAMQLFVI